MHAVLKDNLEGYLSGDLPPAELTKLEAHLSECAACGREWEAYRVTAMDLRILRPQEDQAWEPGPGFYARVMDRIERERDVPFWSLLIDPMFGRRLVFACLMLLALLGGYMAASTPSDYPGAHAPEAILAGQPAPGIPAPAAPRFGGNLQQNRGALLVALASDAD